jgi:two-component system, cell cycle sensor histidine kinase and response regulator CckA
MTYKGMQKTDAPQILVVDDIPANLKLITGILSKQGYRVRASNSGKLALKTVAVELPDLILLDVKMPDMDGYEVCRHLKSDERSCMIPVIFISALDDIADIVKAFEAGGADYISKPFHPAEVIARVETHLGLRLLQLHMEEMVSRRTAELEKLNRTLRESEEKYRNIFENALEGIFQATPEGRFLNVNPAVVKMHGYESSQEMIACITDIEHQVYVDPAERKKMKEMLEKKGIVEAFEIETYKKNREKIWISLTARSVRDIDGTVLYYEGISEDITGRKQAEEEKERLKSQLLQAQKMEALGQLAGGIAHDFNNILTGIKLHAYLGRQGIDSGSLAYIKLKSIEDIVDSSVNLTKQLLGFARGGKYETMPTDLNEIIEKTANFFGTTGREITMLKEYEKDLRAVNADQGQMEQVFLNLFVNAQHAMPNGGSLHIRTENIVFEETCLENYSIKPGRYVKITVADTGTGIDEKIKDRIFEPFFTTKERGIGTGLGLASVYGIVKNHGGYITVESIVGKGSTFIIFFPASDNKVVSDKTSQAKLLTGNETILLVEDEKGILNVTMALLEAIGYRVYGAEEGRQAIELYKTHRDDIALVILDLTMPDMDGEETLENLKGINPDIKVILSSGYSMNEKIQRTMQKGCKAFVQKPFDIRMLSVKIREILDN